MYPTPIGRSRQMSNMSRGRNSRNWRRDNQRLSRALSQEILTPKRRLLKMIVSNLQPLEITEHTDFQCFVETLKPAVQIPASPRMSSLLLSVFQEQETELRGVLNSVDDIVLTCELWSSRREESYLTVGCHFVDTRGKLKSYMLKTTSLFADTSAANVKNQLTDVMDAWGVREKVHTVIRAGIPQLKDIKSKWTHIPCFADTLNVVFKDLRSDDELSNVLRKCQNIIRFFKHNSEADRRFRELQHQLALNQDELIMNSGDQWLTWLHMLERLQQQYRAMVMVLDDRGRSDLILNENDKKKQKNLISALKPLEEATSKMKTQGFESISNILPLLKTLMNKLGEESKNNEVAQKLLTKCKKEFGDVDNHRLAPITFLDPRFKRDLGQLNTSQAKTEITTGVTAQGAISSSIRGALSRYMSYEPAEGNSNPLAWWRLIGNDKFGELSRFALKKLGVVSTAVPLDRAFSSAGDRFCSLRNSIEPENLNMVLFLNSNWSA
ncbi:uncharacterized protein LOC113139923 [Mastacembelus armatus]|uniref:uncharacterized protein LOC113139923 n=1 Tax=Mastacembelus armatus TaxID=205130 RepID=UPI000E45E16A|nr:uncharacterized protein LOC113139923 [Mastacembelus armatus]